MEERVIVDSSFPAVINAPLEKIDIPVWCFSLPDEGTKIVSRHSLLSEEKRHVRLQAIHDRPFQPRTVDDYLQQPAD
jgi:hypothetical protein